MTDTPVDRPITRTLATRTCGAGSASLTLSHYPGRAEQRRHAHDHMQVSFLLLGDMCETIGRRDFDLSGPAMCIKPEGMEHADRWGDRGTLIASVRLNDADAAGVAGSGVWQPCDRVRIRHAAAIVFGCPGGDPDEAIDGLLALIPASAPARTRAVPPWLRKARDAILDGERVSVAAVADDAGIHRVHLSRAFADHFGMPISLYRRRAMLARAVEAMARSESPLASIAAQAGFADQSHMTRTTAEALALTPKRLRQALS